MPSSELSNLERAALESLTQGDDPSLRTLAAQLPHARVLKRELTGAGFFTHLSVDLCAPRLASSFTGFFGDARATIEGIHHGAGFVLHIREGAIDFLEGYSHDEPWPPDIASFTIECATTADDIRRLRVPTQRSAPSPGSAGEGGREAAG